MRRPRPAALKQLALAGYYHDSYCRIDGPAVRGTLNETLRRMLNEDPKFTRGPLHGLHADVGLRRADYRSDRGTFGPGSLQIVVNIDSGEFYCDVDGWSPYTDVVGLIGHTGEVIAGWWKGWA